MTVIMALTLEQLVRRRSSILTSLLCLSPVFLAVVFRLSDQSADPERWTARALYSGLVLAVVLPLASLMYGTSSLGNEIEDGTAAYLLSKPLPRWEIIAAKVLVAWAVTAISVVTGAVIGGLISLDGSDPNGLVLAFSVAVALASLVYCGLFVLLSIVTSRALIAGMVYVFLWEDLVTGLFAGLRVLSVRQYCLGIADLLSSAASRTFQARMDGTEALVLLAVAGAIAISLAVMRLQSFEARDKG